MEVAVTTKASNQSYLDNIGKGLENIGKGLEYPQDLQLKKLFA